MEQKKLKLFLEENGKEKINLSLEIENGLYNIHDKIHQNKVKHLKIDELNAELKKADIPIDTMISIKKFIHQNELQKISENTELASKDLLTNLNNSLDEFKELYKKHQNEMEKELLEFKNKFDDLF